MNLGFFVFKDIMKDIDWKNRWKNVELDQWNRENKRQIKRRNHKANRRFVKDALENGIDDEEKLNHWKDLGKDDR